MAFDVWVELVCANCSETGCGQHIYGRVPRREILKNAKGAGWLKGGPDNEEMFCGKFCKDDYDSNPDFRH
jgi:hypothetical protein